MGKLHFGAAQTSGDMCKTGRRVLSEIGPFSCIFKTNIDASPRCTILHESHLLCWPKHTHELLTRPPWADSLSSLPTSGHLKNKPHFGCCQLKYAHFLRVCLGTCPLPAMLRLAPLASWQTCFHSIQGKSDRHTPSALAWAPLQRPCITNAPLLTQQPLRT